MDEVTSNRGSLHNFPTKAPRYLGSFEDQVFWEHLSTSRKPGMLADHLLKLALAGSLELPAAEWTVYGLVFV